MMSYLTAERGGISVASRAARIGCVSSRRIHHSCSTPERVGYLTTAHSSSSPLASTHALPHNAEPVAHHLPLKIPRTARVTRCGPHVSHPRLGFGDRLRAAKFNLLRGIPCARRLHNLGTRFPYPEFMNSYLAVVNLVPGDRCQSNEPGIGQAHNE